MAKDQYLYTYLVWPQCWDRLYHLTQWCPRHTSRNQSLCLAGSSWSQWRHAGSHHLWWTAGPPRNLMGHQSESGHGRCPRCIHGTSTSPEFCISPRSGRALWPSRHVAPSVYVESSPLLTLNTQTPVSSLRLVYRSFIWNLVFNLTDKKPEQKSQHT